MHTHPAPSPKPLTSLFAKAALACLLAAAPAQACTSLLLTTADDGYVYGRTMEFGFELESKAVFVPRGYAMTAQGADGKPGKTWTSKYAVIGVNALDMAIVVDGMNEKGLTGGILYFPGYAEYTSGKDIDPAKAMAPWEFLSWALMNFATVDEVKAAIDQVQVVGATIPKMNMVPPFHYTLHDASGKSIVIEPTGGKLVVYDNPAGVMTNSPEFPWHLTNLRNYVKLNSENAPALKVKGATIESFGEGSGWLGIPGDPTPPSRFIRALAFSMSVTPTKDGIESVRLAEHIMNNFDIPYGSIRDDNGKPADYTQWTTIADITGKAYYVRTYNNSTLKAIAFSDFDLDAKKPQVAELPDDLTAPALFSK